MAEFYRRMVAAVTLRLGLAFRCATLFEGREPPGWFSSSNLHLLPAAGGCTLETSRFVVMRPLGLRLRKWPVGARREPCSNMNISTRYPINGLT